VNATLPTLFPASSLDRPYRDAGESGLMFLDAIPAAVAEIVAYVVGKVTGRACKLAPERAQRIGEYFVMAVIIGAGVAVTLVYS
jgi:hypothetical protein